MLAKIWKKVLLAICIIACIFNIMSKLVNRHSLRENLESANDGETVFSIFQKDEVVESESKPIIDGVMNSETTTTTENNTTENNTSVVSNYTENEVENASVETVVTETETENVEENVTNDVTTEEQTTEENNNGSTTFKFSDFTILF